MVIVTVQDAAWQEIVSVGGASAISVTITEILRLSGIASPKVMMAVNLVIMILNMYWQYVDNGGLEQWTVPRQLSRLGVNATVFFVGLGLYGLFLGYYGITNEAEMSKHLHIVASDASAINGFLAFLASSTVYAVNRAVFNFILLLVAIGKKFFE